jgi:serine/threonine protein kinase
VNYLLVLEYADGGTLRNYLKKNFSNLTWDDKYKLAYQLACALSCLHDEGIVHRDLVITNHWSKWYDLHVIYNSEIIGIPDRLNA